MKTIVSEMISSLTYSTLALQLQSVIDTSVVNDPYKEFTYAQFQTALTANVSVGNYSVPGISTLMNARDTYLNAQAEFTASAPTISLVSTSTPSLNGMLWIKAAVSGATVATLGYRIRGKDIFTKITM